MDLRLSGFMEGHYPPSPASSKARRSPNGSVILNLLAGREAGSYPAWGAAGFCCFGKGLDSRACVLHLSGDDSWKRRVQPLLGGLGTEGYRDSRDLQEEQDYPH